jgi:hypothetical protein
VLLDLRSLEAPPPPPRSWLATLAVTLAAWNIADPAPTLPRPMAPLAGPPFSRPWLPGVIASWAAPDPLPTLPHNFQAPGAPGWSLDPPKPDAAGLANLSTTLAAWVPPDPPPVQRGPLNPSITAVPVNNPPAIQVGLLGILAPWLPGDPQPWTPRYGVPTPTIAAQPPIGAPWLSAVLIGWATADPPSAAPRPLFRPGMSVDPPPAKPQRVADLALWIPPDPLPTLPPLWAGRPGWSVDNPPALQRAFVTWPEILPTPPLPRLLIPVAPQAGQPSALRPWFPAIETAWQPGDPDPQQRKLLPASFLAVRVDPPPRYSVVQLIATVAAWNIPGDPPPQGFHDIADIGGVLVRQLQWFRLFAGARDRLGLAGKRDRTGATAARDRTDASGARDRLGITGSKPRTDEGGSTD